MDIKIQDVPQIGNVRTHNNVNKNSGGFKDIYNAAINMVEETNTLQKTADQMGVDFALGKIDSVSDMMIAQEKASIALQYTVQIRDTVLEAYNQIMRMQV